MAPEDHPILDDILAAVLAKYGGSRESECIEFEDENGRWEIVVRRLDNEMDCRDYPQ